MHVRIKPHLTSANDIALGTLEFPAQWVQIPLPKTPQSQREHTCAAFGRKWCGDNEIEPNLSSMYRFDRAVWAVTIIDSLLFDCQTGSVVVNFVQETNETDYAIVMMSTKLLVDLRDLVTRYFNLPDDPDILPAFEKTMLSFCIDVYATYILHELKHTGCIPSNYFIWIAQVKRKGFAQESCLKAKEIADVLETHLGGTMDPELDDWVKHCIDEPLQDTLDYILAHDSRKSKDTGSLSDTSCELSSSSPPSTPNSRLSDTSTASSDDSPTPAEEIDLYAHYRNQFDLPSDLLREIDPKRMARLLPPKLSRRGLMMEEDLKDKLEELEARIAFYMNNVRRLEKLVAEEEIKERKLFNSYLPEQEREDMVALDEINHTIPAKTSNFTARRSSAPIYESHSMKKKGKNHRRQRSAYRSLSKRRNKKKLVKTPEEYEEEWQRRQDSPYTRRHSEMITGKSANEMMFSSANLSLSSSSIDIAVDFCNLRKKLKSQQETKKRKFDMIRGNVEFSMKKKLKLTLKLAGETFKTGNYRYESEEDEDDELDDPDWKESGQGRRKTKKSGRNGKDLGHRRNSSEDLDDNLPPSTARYLESLRAPYARAVGSEQISERELQALSLAARGNTSTSSPARISVPRSSSSSTSTLVDLREDSEPGWEVKSRTPLSTRSLSHASSRSNSNLLSRPSSSSSSGIHRPALRRERTSIHLNAFFIGVPADIAASVLLPNGVLSQEDIPVPQHDFQLDYANLSSDISATSEQQEIDDDDEFILGILSPERKLPPIEEEQEPSIFAETCPELDELSSSPEDLDDDVGHQHKSVGPPSGQAQEEGRETCEGGDAVAITNAEEAQEQGDGIEENQSNSDAVGKGVDEADLKLKPPSALLARPEDLFDDEAVAEEARSDEAIIRRLRSSIALGLDMIVEEEESNDVDFVQGLLEQFGMRVNRPGSPAPKDPVIFPVKKESSYKNTTAIEHEKLKISDNKSKGSDRRAKTIEEILSHVTTGLPKSSAAISAKREVISRPVTRTYPSKRGNRQKPLDFSSNRSGSMSCGNGASIPRPNSPYRVPSDIRDVVDPVSVFQFLTGLGKEEGKYEVEKIDLTAEAPSEVMNHLEGDCSSTAKKLKEPNYVSANKLNNNTGNHRGKAPLSPVKVIQHKRYPGMLTSPERKCKAIAPIVCESKSSSLDGGQQLMVQTPKDGKADLDTAMDDQELEGVTNSDGLTSANMTIVELK